MWETQVQSLGQEDPLEKGEGNGYPLQYSCLENPVDRGACRLYSPWGHKDSDTPEQLTLSLFSVITQEMQIKTKKTENG